MAGLWWPRAEGQRIIWINNFLLKIPGYQATLGFVLADITAITNDLNAYLYSINIVAIFKSKSQDCVRFKDDLADGTGPSGAFPANTTLPAAPVVVANGVVARLTAFVARCTSAPGYTAAIGEDLGIVAPVEGGGGVEPTDPQPTGNAFAMPNSQVQINWVKAGFTGVIVESQRGTETGWTVLAQDFNSPYVDARAPLVAGQAEVRKYRLRYLQGDTPVGVYSDVIVVSTTP